MLFDTEALGVAFVDRELRYVRVNRALAAMNGLGAEEHAGRRVRDVIPAAAADALEPLLRGVLETGEPVVDLAVAADVPGRERRDFLTTYYPVRDAASGAVTGVAAIVVERTPAEVALRETERRLRRVAESGIVGLFLWNLDGGITEANDAFLRMLGYTQADVAAGRVDWRTMTPPEYAARDEAAVQELLATGSHGQLAKEYVGKDGRRVPVVVTSAFLDGSADRGVCVCLDDTARRAAEARLGRVLMQTPAAVAVLLGPDHVVQSANEMFLRLLGRRDYVGRPAREGAPELAEQGFLAFMDEVYRSGVPYHGREALLVWDRDGDGTRHHGYFDFVYQPLLDADGAVEGILVFAVEVTAQVHARQATERAAERAERLRALTAALAGARTVEDVAEVVVAQAAATTDAKTGMLVVPVPGTDEVMIVRQTGFSQETFGRYARFPLSLPGPAAHCLRTGEPVWVSGQGDDTLSARFPELAGVWESAEVSAVATVPLAAADPTAGAMSFTFGAPRAFTPEDREFFLALGRQAARAVERTRLFEAERAARAAAEAARAEAEAERERLDAVLGQLPVGVIIVDALSGRALVINDAVARIWGQRPATAAIDHYSAEWVGYHPDGRRVAPDEWPIARAVRGGEAVADEVIEIERPDGGRALIEVSAAPVRDAAGRVRAAVAVIVDITTRVRAERERERLVRALEVERARLAEIFRQVPTFTAVLRGPEHVFELANDAYYQLVGHRELLGRTVAEALPEFAGQGFLEILDGVLATGTPWTGREVPARVARTPGAPPEQMFVDVTYMALVEADGTRSGIVAHGSDVTAQVRARGDVERLLAESERARAEAEAARREAEAANRAKGEFLAVMSHELRTPLNAIGGYAELLEMGIRGPVTAQQAEDLRRIQTSQRHLLGLINEVLNYAKLETGTVHYDLADVRVRDVLAATEGLVAPQARAKGLALTVAACEAALTVRADADKLRQILVNLLSNAVKFTERGGRIAVGCAASRGDRVAITVADTGIGIPADQLERIFEPFVQVRADLARTAEGTGLGLAISRDLARGMGGDLAAASEFGAGSTFTLTLPRA